MSLLRPLGPMSAPRSVRRVLLCGLVLAAMSVSCQWILRVEEPQGRDFDGQADPCVHAEAPPAPEIDDDPSPGSQKSYWLAAQRLIVPLYPDAGIKPGLDLDHSCTCQADRHDGEAPCKTPASNAVRCDDDGGVDDSLGRLAIDYANVIPGLDFGDEVNRGITRGQRTILVQIANYNGKANDKEVRVALVRGTGIFSNLGCGDVPRADGTMGVYPDGGDPGETRTPLWDGCDRWTTNSGLIGKYPDRTALGFVAGYVANHVLVYQVVSAELPVFGGTATFSDARGIIKLTPVGDRFRGDGLFGGRVSFGDVMRVFGQSVVNTSGGQKPLCELAEWGVATPIFCTARDTMSSPLLDHRRETCDAMSAFIGAVFRSAQVDDSEYTRPDSTLPCDAAVECPL